MYGGKANGRSSNQLKILRPGKSHTLISQAVVMPIMSEPKLTPITNNKELITYSVSTVDFRCNQTSLLGKNTDDKTASTGMLISKATTTAPIAQPRLLFCCK